MAKQWLTSSEKIKILSLPDRRETKDGGLRDYCILDLLFNAGIRKGELINLNVGDLNADGDGNSYLRVKTLKQRGHKKESVREIPLKSSTVTHLLRYLKAEYNGQANQPDLPLFRTLGKHGPYGKQRITPMAIHLLTKKYAKLAGIRKNISTHSFRHSFATHLLVDKKVDLRTVQELMGHEHILSTEVYLHTTEIKKREAVELL